MHSHTFFKVFCALQLWGYTRATHTSKGTETGSSLLSCRHWARCCAQLSMRHCPGSAEGTGQSWQQRTGRGTGVASRYHLSRSGSLSPSRSFLWEPHSEMSGGGPFNQVWSTLPSVWKNSDEKSTGNQDFQVIPLWDNPFHFDEMGIGI